MIGLLGLDHTTTDVALRGRLSFVGDELATALRTLLHDRSIDEAVILSTCNRTEVYLAGGDWTTVSSVALRFLSDQFWRVRQPVEHQDPTPHALDTAFASAESKPDPATDTLRSMPYELESSIFELQGQDAVRHLLAVAAGLRSMVVGESQILGQVREALVIAESAQAAGESLRPLFNLAIRYGKRARSETEISRADVSVASVAIDAARNHLGTILGKTALIIGAGRTSQLCGKLLLDEGVGRLLLANRTSSTAQELADSLNATPVLLQDIETVLPDVQLVVSATAAPHTIITASQIAAALEGREEPLVILDLAVPADVEPTVATMHDVTLITLDTLRARGLNTALDVPDRAAAIAHVERLVEDGVREYMRAQAMRLAVPGIAALRQHVDLAERAELDRVLSRLNTLTDAEKEQISRFGQRLVDKMFHHLVSRIRSLTEYDEISPEITMLVLSRVFGETERKASPKERAHTQD